MNPQAIYEVSERVGRAGFFASLAADRMLRAFRPDIDVQVVTGSDGRTRVIVRPLGRWS